ncbi:MAG: 16S rRNA (cytosine(1402)-N(4))-methyltransferase RsmH [Clostridiales bacterium]|nr:16S rRNA (cytosine(1402)-N(4))-methyltransferase RsmH [Clostridiales bacterium]
MEFKHVPVMLNECIEGLNIKPTGIYLDGTLGGAGHSSEIVKRLTTGKLIAIDKDEEALAVAKERLKEYSDKIIFIHDDFKNAIENLDKLGIGKIDGVLLDLGVSSYQLDNAERGFSYNSDAPLDMRMDQSQSMNAYEVVNNYSEKELADVLWKYGEEKLSRKIAFNIVKARQKAPIKTTLELAQIVLDSYPAKLRWKGGNPCKRTFQAIRIEVNGELRGLSEAIEALTLRLNEGGRICVITFHSLEDRIAKQIFVYLEKDCICPPEQLICTCNKRRDIKIITKHPILPTEEELDINTRSQSAKLRIAERI